MRLFDVHNFFKLPEDYKGEFSKKTHLTKFQPRKWTEKEIEWALMLKAKGFNIEKIAQCLDRDFTQVSIKMKRLNKKDGESYNSKHRDDKYYHNDIFLKDIQPNSVLDLYAGQYSYYEDKVNELITNDKNDSFNTYFNENAEKLVHKLYYENYKFDLIDIDPFGSAYECFDCSIKMARKGIIITFGELGHKRFKRLDYVSRIYGINNLEDFTIDKLIEYVIIIGKRNRKNLQPVIIRNYKNISRVYFKIS
jgi:hypothetical protein